MSPPTRKDETNAFSGLLPRYHAALESLTKFGISVAPTSRLRLYERRLEQAADESRVIDPALADALTFDLREIDELIEILEGFDQEPTEGELTRLRLLPKGHEHPDSKANARSRDAQYELFLRAVFKRGGCAVVMTEPDLLVDVAGNAVQVAAKRPASERRLEDRLRHAVTQVERRSEPAVVALSLDHAIRPPGRFLEVASEESLAPAVAALVGGFLAPQLPRIARRVRGRGVNGVLFTTRIPGVSIATNRRILGTSHHLEILADPGTEMHNLIERLGGTIDSYLR